ncbi:homoserine dehydrogenase [Rhodospirillum rubrum]|uniref:Homoserine dehydrogenase n=1 Tax=Rhodospirillum rubrum (strain ATCC 11170 / ATH 1.1.1 / DSM 467 / LMG 4362 / NCIMB 8255 / S1) TaxID=269796 RepID=Q2RRN5_RHORT|nr:homoserine dehydrogenase [Rhodospirillum rubrum]ABC23210.1 homoserine dehydrogenase [Rhodospirillum rubrum ATCC 11170]AEO48941.1 homoserine dehydrogenase [Rhodospirillum rubrum F11]MBK5954844.1 homoserine dehydrogenase [Rhodospirillum rubrum]QXG79187.1 homoserine dehydrogenase [Rhodospirillum rubrum]HAP99529.1 homoserine dehydrogenase [Rhodospirillum rubrum]
MNDPLKVAVAGLGTVGAGVVKLLADHKDLLAARAGRPVVVSAVSARSRTRDRGVDLSSYAWFDDPVALVREAKADVVVELIGGSDGPAKAVCETALDLGRPVVTANKALLAHHGLALAARAEATGAGLWFEAAVAGGIPIIKALREGLAANRIDALHGILNGTCNYILTTMRESGRDFADVLAEAQALGYAEADPGFDIDGIDAAHKLALLASLAFHVPVDLGGVSIQGIRHISSLDIRFADELGYRIKLLAMARRTAEGVEQRVAPVMVPLDAPLAHVEGVNNAVVTEGDFVGRSVFQGRGAGAGPTASAVVADLIDLARGHKVPVFGVPSSALSVLPRAEPEDHVGRYYVRLMVVDRPGVFAEVAAALRDEQVSMESVLQRARDPGETVPVVMTLHDTGEAAMTRALARIGAIDAMVEPPRVIRIEQF